MTWLATLAMLLIVVMPVLSRTMPAMPGMAGDCPDHQAASATHPHAPQAPADPTERCGYCYLLHHTPPLTPDVVVYQAALTPLAAVASAQRISTKPASPRLSADPRGPPSNA